MMLLTLEVEHGVDQVLEDTRPGQGSLLGDMADQERRDPSPLGDRHEPSPALPNLGHAAGGGLQRGQKHGLDRVDDQDLWLHGVELGLHGDEIGLRPQEQSIAADAQALGAQLHLGGRLLGRHVQDRRRRRRQRASRLDEQCALADSRIAPDEHERARHHAPAEHAVELTDAGPETVRVLHGNVAERARPAARQADPTATRLWRSALLDQGHQLSGHPLAVRARAGLRAGEAALLAAIDVAVAHHLSSLRGGSGLVLALIPLLAKSAEEVFQDRAPLGPVEDGDETLVERRIGDEGAERSLALVDLGRDLFQVPHRHPQIVYRTAETRVARVVLDQAAQRPPTTDDPVRDLSQIVADDAEVLQDLLVLRIEEQAGQEAVFGIRRLSGAPDALHGRHQLPGRLGGAG